jgi:3-phosphoshikimate 1-carboxyvinyltransferase
MSNPAAVEADTILRPLRVSRPTQGLVGDIRVPGDSALGQRAMAIAALAIGPTDITGLPDSEATRSLAAALRQLGAGVEQPAESHWRIHGRGIGGLAEPGGVLEAGTSPLVAHLLAGLLAGHPFLSVLGGDAGPVEALLEALSATGARLTARRTGCLPLVIEGAAEPLPLDLTLPADPSGALTSAALLAGLCARGTTRLTHSPFVPAPFAPAQDDAGMPALLRHFGATLREKGGFFVEGQPELQAAPLQLPAEPLSAAVVLAAAVLVPGSRLSVRGIRPDASFPAALRKMGAALEQVDGHANARHSVLHGIDLPAQTLLAEGPALAVVAAFAHGTSRLRGAALAWGEARLDATLRLLAANGADAMREGHDLILTGTGKPLKGGAHLAIQEEPCIAMSAIVLGLAAETPVTLEDRQGIDTAFPGFLQALGQAAGIAAMVPA